MTVSETVPTVLLTAPLEVPDPTATLGRSLWLYLALVRHVNDRGLVIRRSEQLACELSVAESEIEAWLSRLVEAKLVDVLSSAPFLTIRLSFWPARAEAAAFFAQKTHSYSNSSKAAALGYSSNAEEGGPGEGEDSLRDALASILVGVESAEITRILTQYPHAVLRRTLDRVQATPPETIRKSKAALFRYLLGKFSKDHP